MIVHLHRMRQGSEGFRVWKMMLSRKAERS